MQFRIGSSSLLLVMSLGCGTNGGTGPVTTVDSGTMTGMDRPAVTGDGGNNCASATACGACSAMGSCGWCGTTNRCLAGTSTGSTDGTCMGANWAWTSSRCADGGGVLPPVDAAAACAAATTCDTCTPLGSCGWCIRTNSCQQGTSAGSANCMGADWAYTRTSCPGFDGGTSCRTGVPRTCGLTIAGAVRTCTPGAMVTVGCAAACGLGTCTGDAVMQVCAGADTAAPCATALASNDDYGTLSGCGNDAGEDGDLCPATQFTCPAGGMYTIWTGAYNSTGTATCTPAVR